MTEMQELGVTTLVSEISCVVDHAKLPNLVIVAVVIVTNQDHLRIGPFQSLRFRRACA